ncbi:MAG: hypothetical protein WD597_07885, partial [Balneolaceae bacterium]
TNLHFEVPVDPNLLLFIFFGTAVGYNFVKYAGVANLHHLIQTKNLQAIRLFSLVCFAGMVYFAFQLSFDVLIAGAFFGLLTILYALPIFRAVNLRSLKGAKIFVIALVWAGSTVILPLMEIQNLFMRDAVLEFIQRFLFVIALMLPFEIRDLKYDLSELKTIPQSIGISRTRWFGAGLMILILMLQMVKIASTDRQLIALFSISVITTFMIFISRTDQPKYFAAFWVESIPIFWWVLLVA